MGKPSWLKGNQLTPEEKRVKKMKEFIEHLTAYIIVVGALMVLNLVTGSGYLWFLWVAFGWGIGLAFDAVDTFMGDGSSVAKSIIERIDRNTNSQMRVPAHRPVVAGPERAPSQSEAASIVREGQRVVDGMRESVRRLPAGSARRDALLMVGKADEILMVIEEKPDEVLLARDFLNGLLTPVGKLLSEYSQLVARNVESAQPTLRDVEQHDFPALLMRLDAVYERLHRGNLIDLEVAREMMSLDTPIQAATIE